MDTGGERQSKPDGWRPEPKFPKGHRYEGKPRCQAWNSNKGQQCGNTPKKLLAGGHPADPENYLTVCRVHGGDSPRGDAHYNYQGKGYSRYQPAPLQPAITAFLESEDPLDLIQAISTWEGRSDQLLRSLEDGGDPGKLWGELEDHWSRFWAAFDADQFQQANTERKHIDRLLNQGTSQAETWRQIKESDEMLVKLVTAEDKKRDRARGYIRAETVRHHYNALRAAVVGGVEMIDDPELQKRIRRFIAEQFIRLAGPTALSGSLTSR